MKMLSTKEVSEKLGVSIRRVQQMISEGTLPANKVGRDFIILEKDLENVTTYGKPGRPKKKDSE
jgi:excisionase family DNA binding protein